MDSKKLPLEIQNRARSITVGTAFGGTVEITMRKFNGSNLYAILQPVETVELIHQLAASIGCHINIKPRNDFSSWREWKSDSDTDQGAGWPPFSNDTAPHSQRGATLPPPEKQPGFQPKLTKDEQNETVATEKPKHKRSAKRTATTA